METSRANTSEEDLYGDIDGMYVSQSDREMPQTSEDTLMSTSQSVAETTCTSQDDTDLNYTEADNVNDLDLYDDLIVEEGQQRIESFQEIIKKYEEAMNLKNRLESENQALREMINKKESDTKDMQKNFSSLLITAKGEINRKDKELDTLRKRLSGSPRSSFRYRIPRKSATDQPGSTSAESDFDPLCVSSPGGQRLRNGAETVENRNVKCRDSPLKLDRNSEDCRKKYDRDDRSRNKSPSNDRYDRTKKYNETRKDSRVLDTDSPTKKGKYKSASESEDKGSERLELRNNRSLNVDRSDRRTKHEKESERDSEKSRNDRNKEKERRKETRQSQENVSENRKEVSREVHVESRDNEMCRVTYTKDTGKETKVLDLREKLRLKKLGIQSNKSEDIEGSNFKCVSVKHSLTNTPEREAQGRDNSNIIKLKQGEDLSSSHENAHVSIIQSKQNRNRKKSGDKGKQDFSSEKKFLEKLKISIKKNDNINTYKTSNFTNSDKRTDAAPNQKTQNKSVREIRSYSDVTHELSDFESITDTDRTTAGEHNSTASSENYFSASEVPCYASSSENQSQSKMKERLCGTSGKSSNMDADMENAEQSENDSCAADNRKKTCVNDLDKMEVDTKTGENVDIYCKRNSLLQKKNDGKSVEVKTTLRSAEYRNTSTHNSARDKDIEHDGKQDIMLSKKAGTIEKDSDVKYGHEERPMEIELSGLESDTVGVKILQSNSDSNTEIEIQKKWLNGEVENDSAEVTETPKEKESPGMLRRSSRLLSRSDTLVSLCNSNTDTENLSEGETKTRRKSNDKKTLDNPKDTDEIEEEIAMSEKILSGNIHCTSSKRKKKRIHRSVTSETISSVTSIDTSESASEVLSSMNEEPEDSSPSTENFTTSDNTFSSEKGEKLQKWVCTDKNCTIKMRHLHPKCNEQNTSEVDLEKERQKVMTDKEIASSHGDLHDESEKMEVDNTKVDETKNSAEVLQRNAMSPSVTLELAKNKNLQQVTNGTIELAGEETISSSSSSSSASENSSDGSTSSSDSSASESSSESVFSDRVTGAIEVKEGYEGIGKSPKQSNEVNDKPVADNKGSNTALNTSVNNIQKSTIEADNIVASQDHSSTLSVPSTEVNCNAYMKDSIQKEVQDIVKKVGSHVPDKCGFENKSKELESESIASSKKHTVITNESNDEKDTQNKENADNCDPNSTAMKCDSSHTETNIEKMDETSKSADNVTLLQNAGTDKVSDQRESAGKDGISDNESEGSFGSNIVSERTVSSASDNENDFSDSDDSTDGSYTSGSSYSSSDESGTGSSWESYSSDSEYDPNEDEIAHANVGKITNDPSKTDKKKQEKMCAEKTQDKEMSVDKIEKTSSPTCNIVSGTEEIINKSVKDNQNEESVGESQQKHKEIQDNENKMEVDETVTNHEQNDFSVLNPGAQKCSQISSDSSIVHEKTEFDNNVAIQSQEKTSAVANSSNFVSPDRSHLLQNLLKCVQFEWKGKDSVFEKSVEEIQCSDADFSQMLEGSDNPNLVAKSKEKTIINEEMKECQEMKSNLENSPVLEKKITEQTVTVAKTEKVTQVENAEVVEMDIGIENEAHIKSCSYVSNEKSSEISNVNDFKEASSQQVVIDSEKANTNNKDNKPSKEIQGSPDSCSKSENSLKENNEKSSEKTAEISKSVNRHTGQDLHNISKENIFESTLSSSDASDFEDSSSGSSSHSTDCSTCSSSTGSSTDSCSETDSNGESQKENRQKKIKDTGTDKGHEKNTEKATSKDKTMEHESRESIQTSREFKKDLFVKNKQVIGVLDNAIRETKSLKPCEDNPYWIADEVPAFLKETDSGEQQSKKSPSSESTVTEDSNSCTPAAKFINLSPTSTLVLSPDKAAMMGQTKGANAISQPASGVKSSSFGVISSVIEEAKLEQMKSKDNETGNTKNSKAKGKLKTQLSQQGSNENKGISNKPGDKLKSLALGSVKDNSYGKKTSNTSRYLEISSSDVSVKVKKTAEKNANTKMGNSCKSTNKAKEKEEYKTRSKTSLNSEKEESKLQRSKSRDNNMQQAKSKEPENFQLRRSPRKKPSQTSVNGTDLKANYNEKHKQNGSDFDKTTTSECKEDSIKMNSVKYSNRKRVLKSDEKVAYLSKSADVNKGKEKNAKETCFDSSSVVPNKNFTASRNSSESKKEKLVGNENRKKESKMNDKAKKSVKCVQEERTMNSFTTVATLGKLSAKAEDSEKISAKGEGSKKIRSKEEGYNSKLSVKNRDSSLEKRHVQDTTRVLSEKIMKLKVEKNLLEQKLAEKHRQEKVPLNIKISIPKTTEGKSNQSTKENILKSKTVIPGSSRLGKMKPLTVALAVNGSEDLKSKNDVSRTGSLNKREMLTFEEKLTGSVGSLSQSADTVSKKGHKDMSLSLTSQTATLKTFTIPKLTAGKKGSSNEKKVTKCKSESSMQRRSDCSSGNTKDKKHNESKDSYCEGKKVNNIKSDTSNNKHKTKAAKVFIISTDSESSTSNKTSGSDAQSTEEEDIDTLVKAVFGSSDSSGNSGKSVTLDDLCKTRSSEDTDDIVKAISPDVMMNLDDGKEKKSNTVETKLSKGRAETTKSKGTNLQKHSKSLDRSPENRRKKGSSESKCSDFISRQSKDKMKCTISINRKNDVQYKEKIRDKSANGKSNARNQVLEERPKSVNPDQVLRKSPRIKALNSPGRCSFNNNGSPDLKCWKTSSKDLRSNTTPKKSDQEIGQTIREVRYFEISDQNPVLNKIVSPKKAKHHIQTDTAEKSTRKSRSDSVSKTNELENKSQKETKGIPILLLEENTMDGIDYHDDMTFDIDGENPTPELTEESGESGEEQNNENEKERDLKEQTDSDESTEEGEITESDEESEACNSVKEREGISQRRNEMTPNKLKQSSNKERLSPIQFPSSPYSDREAVNATCIQKRLGLSGKKQIKRYRSDSGSCSDATTPGPKRRTRRDQPGIRKRSRSCDGKGSPVGRRPERSDRLLDSSRRRSPSPRRRNRRSVSKPPCRCRGHSKSRSTSPHQRRRRRSKSVSPVRSRLVRKDRQEARSGNRYRDESDTGSPRQHERSKSKEKSESAKYESSEEENERFSKLKSEKKQVVQKERNTVENSPGSRVRIGRNRDRNRSRASPNYTLQNRRRSRSRSPNRKRKRYISESDTEIETDTGKKVDKRKGEIKDSKTQRHKRSRTDKSVREDLYEKKEKSKKR